MENVKFMVFMVVFVEHVSAKYLYKVRILINDCERILEWQSARSVKSDQGPF